jgi:hypothetical protein
MRLMIDVNATNLLTELHHSTKCVSFKLIKMIITRLASMLMTFGKKMPAVGRANPRSENSVRRAAVGGQHA